MQTCLFIEGMEGGFRRGFENFRRCFFCKIEQLLLCNLFLLFLFGNLFRIIIIAVHYSLGKQRPRLNEGDEYILHGNCYNITYTEDAIARFQGSLFEFLPYIACFKVKLLEGLDE